VVENNVFCLIFIIVIVILVTLYRQLYDRNYFYCLYLELNFKKNKALLRGGAGRQLCQFMLRLEYSDCR